MSESSGLMGVPSYAVSLTSGSAMSEPIPGISDIPCSRKSSSISMTSGGWGWVAGLMQTSPSTSGCIDPTHSVRAPPMLRPATTTPEEREASRW